MGNTWERHVDRSVGQDSGLRLKYRTARDSGLPAINQRFTYVDRIEVARSQSFGNVLNHDAQKQS